MMVFAGEAAQLPAASQTTALKWSKAPCRFCGTGCSVMVATKEGHVVATHGDVHSQVNRGLSCVKGYFLSKIMYGQDRLTQPLLRMTDGKYDKNGEFTPVSWDQALTEITDAMLDAVQDQGPESIITLTTPEVAAFGSRAFTNALGSPITESRPGVSVVISASGSSICCRVYHCLNVVSRG